MGAIISTAVTIGTRDAEKGAQAGCMAGLAKELYDQAGYGTPEFADFAWTCAGAIIPLIILHHQF